jgi:hypothetical protein
MWLQPGEKYGWLLNKLQCGCNHWCATIEKKIVAKNEACEWLQPCGGVIAPLEQWFCKKTIAKNTGKKKHQFKKKLHAMTL